ncbi:hypothetical protein ACWOEJ_03695 [Enterococcus eurekensis]|uniref:Uncharacterized protein n=1 Tax=Enterococcus eurekensis TaxID=1159753 RepID=A0ABV9M2K8_9ENTE
MAMAEFVLIFNWVVILFKFLAVVLFFKYCQKILRVLEEIRDKQ